MVGSTAYSSASQRRSVKSDAAFRTISEVSDDLDVPQHVLRFWESKFTQVRPLKRAGGRRYYRPEDVLLLRRIRDLLYRDGYTIKGVQKLLRDGARSRVIAEPAGADGSLDDDDADQQDMPENEAEQAAPPIARTTAFALNDSARFELNALLAELEDLRTILDKRLR